MKTRLILNLILISLSLSMISCGALVKGMALKKTTVEKNAIPAEFGSANSTLLIALSGKNARDKYLKKYFKKNYHGEFIFVKNDKIDSEKYNDKDIYRYVFDVDRKTDLSPKYNGVNNRFEPNGTTWSKYFIKDRKTDKNYYSKLQSSYFAKLIEAYTINLEKTRKSNS